jgi:putative transposase
MKYNPQKHNRRSIRLQNYDYSKAGMYFITICCQNRAHLFGEITEGVLKLNAAGHMIDKWYHILPEKFGDIQCGEYVIMPNHFHAIIINNGMYVGANQSVRPQIHANKKQQNTPTENTPTENTPTQLSTVIQWFKTMTTNEYIRGVKELDWTVFNKKVWQRNYWEHIIRNDAAYARIAAYIIKNPKNWKEDKLF